MIEINEQIKYWQKGAFEDFEVAKQLVDSDKFRHGLFFAHLSLEKILKAHVCKKTNKIAPKLHNLARLSQIAKLELPDDTLNLLAEMNEFNLEGRYPVPFLPDLSKTEAKNYLTQVQEALQWFSSQL